MPVDLHGGGHHARIRTVILIGDHVLDDQQRARRSHHVVGQKDALIIIHSGIDHRRRRARLTGGQQVQVFAHLGLGRARTIHHLDRHHTSNHQHHEDADQSPNQLHALLPHSGHRRKSHASPGWRRRPSNRRGHRRSRYRSRARIILFSAHHALLTTFDIQQPRGGTLCDSDHPTTWACLVSHHGPHQSKTDHSTDKRCPSVPCRELLRYRPSVKEPNSGR